MNLLRSALADDLYALLLPTLERLEDAAGEWRTCRCGATTGCMCFRMMQVQGVRLAQAVREWAPLVGLDDLDLAPDLLTLAKAAVVASLGDNPAALTALAAAAKGYDADQ